MAHEIRQHSTQCRNTPNMVAEQCRSRAKVARRFTRTTTISTAMLTIAVCAHASMVSNSYSCDFDLRFQETDINGDQVCENLTIALRQGASENPAHPIDVQKLVLNVRVGESGD